MTELKEQFDAARKQKADDESGEEETAAGLDIAGTAQIPLVHYMQGCVNFLRSGTKLYAMMESEDGNDVCVGSKAQGGDTHAYQQALIEACSQSKAKVAEVLAANGFNLSCVEVGFDRLVMDEIDKRDSVMKSEYTKRVEELGGVLEQSLSIAAAGIHRGFFNGGQNPMVTSIARRLASAGLDERQAMELIAGAMDESGDEYAELLSNIAIDISGKTEEVRSELANTVMQLRGGLGTKVVMPAQTASDKSKKDLVDKLVVPMHTAADDGASSRLPTGSSTVDQLIASSSVRMFGK